MMSLEMDYSFKQQKKHVISDDEDDCVVPSYFENEDSSDSTIVSSDSDLFGEDEDLDEDEDEVNSNYSSSTSPSGPLQDMSSLFQELPIKRGLSKHYNGKSQSFTSLANVASVEDLAKPENPLNKRLKACKSYAGLVEMHRSNQPHRSASSSRLISKKAQSSSRIGTYSSPNVRRNGSFLGNKPPIHPHMSNSSSNLANQNTPLLA